MKSIYFGVAAVLAVSSQACLLDGELGCTEPKEFLNYQVKLYHDYKKECERLGVEDELGGLRYNPWAFQKSRYAYAEYHKGENPYLGRWKKVDDGSCRMTYKEARS